MSICSDESSEADMARIAVNYPSDVNGFAARRAASIITAQLKLVDDLRLCAPDAADEAVTRSLSAGRTSFGSAEDYLRWCLRRAKAGDPMPWKDPLTEVRRDVERAFDGLSKFASRTVVDRLRRFAAILERPNLLASKYRRQSWQRRRHHRRTK
jgi:hypothetical protein